MKILVLPLLLLSLTALAAKPNHVQFVGTIQHDDAAPFAFDLNVPSRQTADLKLMDGTRLEIATPGSDQSPDGARIRLLSSSGTVLHTATIPDTGLASTSFAYVICDGQVRYISPAPAAHAPCALK